MEVDWTTTGVRVSGLGAENQSRRRAQRALRIDMRDKMNRNAGTCTLRLGSRYCAKAYSCTVRALFDSTKQHRHILPAFEAAALRPRPRRRAEVVLCARVGAARDEEPH